MAIVVLDFRRLGSITPRCRSCEIASVSANLQAIQLDTLFIYSRSKVALIGLSATVLLYILASVIVDLVVVAITALGRCRSNPHRMKTAGTITIMPRTNETKLLSFPQIKELST